MFIKIFGKMLVNIFKMFQHFLKNGEKILNLLPRASGASMRLARTAAVRDGGSGSESGRPRPCTCAKEVGRNHAWVR
jgi:hypothetical protein